MIWLRSCEGHIPTWPFLLPFVRETQAQGKKKKKKKDSEISGFILNHVISLPQVAKESVAAVRQNETEELFGSVRTSARRPHLLYSQRWRERCKDRIRMARGGEKKKNVHKSMLSVRLLTDDWIHAEHHMWDTHAAPAPLLHVPPRGPSTGTTLPLSGCVTSCSQLMTTKVDQHCVVHSLPSYLHPSWGEDTFKHFACLNVIKKDRLHVYL